MMTRKKGGEDVKNDDLLCRIEEIADILEAHSFLWLPVFVQDQQYRAGYADATKAATEKIRALVREAIEKEASIA